MTQWWIVSRAYNNPYYGTLKAHVVLIPCDTGPEDLGRFIAERNPEDRLAEIFYGTKDEALAKAEQLSIKEGYAH